MKLLSITLFTILLCFCNSGDGMSGGDGEQGPPGSPGQQGPTGPQGPPGMSVEHDGNRIKARYITTSDGYKMQNGLWDSQRNEPCNWGKVNNQFRCLPSFLSDYTDTTGGTGGIIYLDDKCQIPIYVAPTVPTLVCDPFSDPIKYVLIAKDATPQPQFCASIVKAYNPFPTISPKIETLYTLGPVKLVSDSPGFYTSSSSMCYGYLPRVLFYYPLTRIEFTEFAEGMISNP